jgi:hypothetical protein
MVGGGDMTSTSPDHPVFGDGLPALPTWFAPPERASRNEVESAARVIADHSLMTALLEATDLYVMVLNQERQVLAANTEFLKALGATDLRALVGRRPGEAVACRHAWDGPAGCGTSQHCATCGAGQAIFESQQQSTTVEKSCLIDAEHDGRSVPFEFQVKASPVTLGDRTLTIVAFRDVSHENRRQVLERTFFHDILNTVGGLKGWGEILARYGEGRRAAAADKIRTLAGQLTREILAQRDLMDAEAGRLQVTVQDTEFDDIISDALTVFEGHDVTADRDIRWTRSDGPTTVSTDPGPASRVVVNMVKNALEATPPGGTVELSLAWRSEGIRLEVWNEGRIPDPVAEQIFKRSFSTKASSGRGLGTWSMKLFGEEYLGGRVDFHTGNHGTVFSFELPVSPGEDP